MFKNRTSLEAHPGPLPTAKMNLLVRIVYSSAVYCSIVTRGSILNVGWVLDLLLITIVFRKTLS